VIKKMLQEITVKFVEELYDGTFHENIPQQEAVWKFKRTNYIVGIWCFRQCTVHPHAEINQ
jgi:hypothetical protein